MKHYLLLILLFFACWGMKGEAQADKYRFVETQSINLWQMHKDFDTIKCIMLYCDTSSQNGYRSNRVEWMIGYAKYSGGLSNVSGRWDMPTLYMDENKRPLKSNIVVWVAKEIK